jgi:hypothetical protein
MPKYRLLTVEELEQFHKEFIEFLVVNGIEPDRWERLKETDPGSVDKIIELFSDVILESVLRKIKFIQIKSPAYVQAIACLDDKMIAIAIEDTAKREGTESDGSPRETSSLSLYKSERFYNGSREHDLFEMLQRGYEISDGELFQKLESAAQ